jgi:hypothetical protein
MGFLKKIMMFDNDTTKNFFSDNFSCFFSSLSLSIIIEAHCEELELPENPLVSHTYFYNDVEVVL